MVYQEVILQPEKMILWNRTVAACQVSVLDKDGLITGAPWSGELELSPPSNTGCWRGWIPVTEALNLRRSSVRSRQPAARLCPAQSPRGGQGWELGLCQTCLCPVGGSGPRGGELEVTPVPPKNSGGEAVHAPLVALCSKRHSGLFLELI